MRSWIYSESWKGRTQGEVTGNTGTTEIQWIPWKVLKWKWLFRNAPNRGKRLNIFTSAIMGYELSLE